jgi:hypothetical protein
MLSAVRAKSGTACPDGAIARKAARAATAGKYASRVPSRFVRSLPWLRGQYMEDLLGRG